jgi:repressor LexA
MSTNRLEAATNVELPEIKAGFPSPAQDYVESGIDLNRELVRNPSSTFFGRARGTSMEGAGIFDGDLLFVSSCSTARNGEIIVALIDDSATVKTFYKENGHIRLQPENDAYEPIITNEVIILGKVVALYRYY